jgi:hypothetical protein
MRTSGNAREVSYGVLVVILFAAAVAAQEKGRIPPSSQETEESEKDPRRKTKSEQAHPRVSFTDSLLLGMGNNATLSFGLYEGYNSDILSDTGRASGVRRPDTITSLYGRFFAQAQRRKSQFSLDYSSGYRIYQQTSGFSGAEHRGSLAFRLQSSRRSWIEVSEHVVSVPNDSHSLLSQPLAPTELGAGISQQAFVDRQRVFSNLAKTELGFELGRRSQLSVSGSYLIQRFRGRPSLDADGFLIGLKFQRQFNRWLTFKTNYQFELSEFNNQLGEANINRFDIGGFNYRLRPSLTLFASGGVEYAEFQETYRPGAMFRGGISKETPTTHFALEYQRGFNSSLGLGTLARGNAFALRLNRRITSWMNILASSIYSRNEAFTGREQASEPFDIFQAQPRLEFAARPNLIFSVGYDYLNQHSRGLEVILPSVNRYYVTFGFEYILGSRR